MPAARDPRSVAYDPLVRRVLLAAIEARKNRRAAESFVFSPPADFRDRLDKGGRTPDERAFTRSVYYQTYRVPVNDGVDPDWSAKLTWGKIERRGGRWGRVVRVRVYKYGWGYRHARRAGGQWITDTGGGSFAEGTRRSLPGARIDG